MTMQEMVTLYHRHSAAQAYILGFVKGGRLYYAKLAFEELANYFKLSHASSKRGGAAKIRIRMTSADRYLLVETGKAVEIGDVSLMEYDDKYNKGEHFERLMTELLTGEVWKKDSTPFNVAGDIRVNGEEIQVKFDDATLVEEKTLLTLAS